jgi:hypothetical protein
MVPHGIFITLSSYIKRRKLKINELNDHFKKLVLDHQNNNNRQNKRKQ